MILAISTCSRRGPQALNNMTTKEFKIFVVQPFDQKFDVVYQAIEKASQDASESQNKKLKIFRAASIYGISIIESLYQDLESSDLVVSDITETNPNVMYELGYAHALKKPVIILSEVAKQVPFDTKATNILFYDRQKKRIEFTHRLHELIEDAIKNPKKFSVTPKSSSKDNNVFISYSHKDTDYLDRLLVHLRPPEKQGFIDFWVDTKLKAGDKWKEQIELALSRARVAILLISADFLASDFIVDNELPPILDGAEAKGTRIIPVIIKPCRFARDPNLKHFQAINDPKQPLIKLTLGEQEEVFDKISEEVEKYIAKIK